MFVSQYPVEALALIAFFLLLAFPVHEFAHAFAAYRLGDSTAKHFGKLTLNPIAHFDQIGGSMLVISVLLTGFPFGFAQTPVNPRNLRGRHGEALVALAGPVSNLLMAAVVAIPFRILLTQLDLLSSNPDMWRPILSTLHYIVLYSILLGLFNLVPIPPLDGGTIMLSLVPPRTAWQIRPVLAQYGFFLLLLLIIPLGGQSVIGRILLPFVEVIYGVLVG